ncbi:MAG: AzlC family ABC transporter permease [Oscillospiraceae bacterium]|nr:AzlC family ABC transporter permease [Oscillospiraceae bacterium]
MKILRLKDFWAGVRMGFPVCVGYFSVSFGFGAMAVAQGLSVWHAILISATNLTSAGQFAGLTVISAGAAIIEMILTQLVINSRYALMSLALGPRFGPSVGTGSRLIAAFFNTDEVFALGMARKEKLTAAYFIGAGVIAAVGWTSGTAMGALAGSLLPVSVRAALGVMLYGMFIAIVVPQARQEKPILISVILALVFSCLFTWVPGLKAISSGLAIVICTVAAAAICAVIAPVADEEGTE